VPPGRLEIMRVRFSRSGVDSVSLGLARLQQKKKQNPGKPKTRKGCGSSHDELVSGHIAIDLLVSWLRRAGSLKTKNESWLLRFSRL
jgi:hypothetical protein